MSLAALLLAATGAVATYQEPPVPLTDAEVVQLVSQDARMTVPVRIAESGPWPFIIDTGAQRTVISRELANVLKLPRGRDVNLTAMTGRARVATAVIPTLSVSTIGGTMIEAPALAARHLGAPGLLGIDTLQDKKVTIDFRAQTMAVSPAVKRKRAVQPGTYGNEVVVVARSYLGQLVVTDADYRGKPVRVVLDTGSAVSVGNSAFQRLVRRQRPTQPVSMTSVTGDQLQAQYTQIDEIRFGSLTFQHLPVAYADAAPFKQFRLEKRPAILLGMDALGLFRKVDIDFANRELRLTRPPSAG